MGDIRGSTMKRRQQTASMGGRVGVGFAVCVALAALTGCTDGEEGRQFATDARRTAVPTATMAVTPPPPPPGMDQTVVPVRPLADLVVARGAPDTVYLRANRDLLAIDAGDGAAADVFVPAENEAIVGSAASPSGDRAAVLTVTRSGQAAVTVIDSAGKRLWNREAPGDALPAAGGPRAPRSIDWSPQGDRLLVSFEPGGIVAMPVDGSGAPALVVPEAEAPWPAVARWSPTGQGIAFISAREGEPVRGLAVVEAMPAAGVGGGEGTLAPVQATPGATPVATPVGGLDVIAGDRDRPVLSFAWLPDGQSLLFTEGGPRDGSGAPANADLWRIETDGDGRRLIASAGSAAPVADVTLIAPSPDGSAVAYTVSIPGAEGEQFHSLWVRDLEAGQGYLIPTDAGAAVTDLRWTSAGLLYRTSPQAVKGRNYEAGEFDVFVIGENGETRLLMTARVKDATPAATPRPS
ncbi:MAG: hypothetical protein ACKOWF_14710 [Chloroflexota bacterium]